MKTFQIYNSKEVAVSDMVLNLSSVFSTLDVEHNTYSSFQKFLNKPVSYRLVQGDLEDCEVKHEIILTQAIKAFRYNRLAESVQELKDTLKKIKKAEKEKRNREDQEYSFIFTS